MSHKCLWPVVLMLWLRLGEKTLLVRFRSFWHVLTACFCSKPQMAKIHFLRQRITPFFQSTNRAQSHFRTPKKIELVRDLKPRKYSEKNNKHINYLLQLPFINPSYVCGPWQKRGCCFSSYYRFHLHKNLTSGRSANGQCVTVRDWH